MGEDTPFVVFGLMVVGGLSGCERSPGAATDEPANAPLASASEPAPEYESDGLDRIEGRSADTANWWDSLPRPEWGAFQRLDDGSGWFEACEVGPGFIAICERGG